MNQSTLGVVHVGDVDQTAIPAYQQLVGSRGQYILVQEPMVVTTKVFTSYMLFKTVQTSQTSQSGQSNPVVV